MAIEFSTVVWQMSPYKAEKLLAQLAFADWCNLEGEFHPSIPEVMAKARLTDRGAEVIIRQMLDDGEIELTEKGGGRGKRNQYRFASHYREAVAELSKNWAAKRARRQGVNPERHSGNEKTETPNEIRGISQQTPNEVPENPERGSCAYKELSPSCIPSEREKLSPAGCLPILLEAYKNIAKDRVSQDQLSWQCQMLESEGVTSGELSEWLKSRRSLSSIKFIGQDFRTWKESTARQNQKQVIASTPKKYCGACKSGWLMPDRSKGETHARQCSCQSKQSKAEVFA